MTADVPSLADVPRTLPALDDVNRPFWTGGREGQLLIMRCEACRTWVHPPTGECTSCGGPLCPEPVSGRATLFTFTVNRHPFNPAVPLPYVIAIVELEEQADLRLVTNLVDVEIDTIRIGMPLRVSFEDRGEIFVPVFEPDPPQ